MREVYLDSSQIIDLQIELEKHIGFESKSFVSRYWAKGLTSFEGVQDYVVSFSRSGIPNVLFRFSRDHNGQFLKLVEQESINYVKANLGLSRWGKVLKAYPGRKIKEPDEIFPEHIIFEIKELNEKTIHVKLPGVKKIFEVSRFDVYFMDRKPTGLEFRLQEMRFRRSIHLAQRDVSDVFPIYYFLSSNADKVLTYDQDKYIKLNIWDVIEEKRLDYDLTVDEALIGLQAAVYNGSWTSFGDPEKDFLHSDYFEAFTEHSQYKTDANSKQIYLIYQVFLEQLTAAFKAIEYMNKYATLKAQDKRKVIRLVE